MYQALLTIKYLSSKVMPLLAALAVMLCTAMVLIVWSVMGGFLNMFLESGKALIGDVSITYRTVGIAYYEDLIKRLESDPTVEAAAPMIEGYGLIRLPHSRSHKTVGIWGVDGERLNRVVNYNGSLWWKPLAAPLESDKKGADFRLRKDKQEALHAFEEQAHTLTSPRDKKNPEPQPALVPGIEVGGYNERMPGGYFDPILFLPGEKATLSVAPLDSYGHTLPYQTRILPIANQFQTGMYDLDANIVMVRLDELQKMLFMEEAEKIKRDSSGEEITAKDPVTGVDKTVTMLAPGRVTTILIKARSGVNEQALKARCAEIYAEFSIAHANDTSPPPPAGDRDIEINTWREKNGPLISAVEKEIGLTLVLFGIISLTAVFLVLAIFWAMVSEKTKDIGVLRAIGASRSGVAGLWLAYGLAIGIVGAILGGIAAVLIVHNINPIHEWIGRQFGLVIWDPKIYYFTRIPAHIVPMRAVGVLVGGVLASVFGALIPAIKAARMDPVRSLRFE